MSLSHADYRTPGQLLRAALKEKGWSQRILAVVIGIEPTAMGRVLRDLRPIDAPMALALSDVFEIPAERLLALQQEYELAKARLTTPPNPGRARRARLLGELPISEMATRGWITIKDVRDVAAVEAELARFFGREVDFPHAAMKAEADAEPTPVQLAWLRQVQKIAETIQVPRYSPAAVRDAVGKLGDLRGSVEGVRKVGEILASCGIRFVVVESLTSAKIDGVCFWLNDMAPVIGITLRHDRIDNFWFVLRHEIEHVLRGHGRQRPMIDVELEGERVSATSNISEEERVANAAAADFCVPKEHMDFFIAKKSPYFFERDVLGFAASLKLHPGLVIGQLQHRTGRFDRFRKHLARVRTVVVSEVAVDGWGDTYPVAELARTQ
jgi:HTH-type transcriptional regulator/antitoxin HigA